MRVLLLGTSGYHPTAKRHTACVLLPELGIVLDAGTGMFRVGPLLQTSTLDIFLSHAHLDHVVGLSYFFTLKEQHPLERITVHGATDKLTAIREHLFHPTIFPGPPPYVWSPLQSVTHHSSGATIHAFPLEHPGGSMGFRIEYGEKSFAYVTDTSALSASKYIDHIRGVDLLMHECNFPGGFDDLARRTGHSALPDVAALAREAQVKRLVLLHFDPVLEINSSQLAEARAVFPACDVGDDECELWV